MPPRLQDPTMLITLQIMSRPFVLRNPPQDLFLPFTPCRSRSLMLLSNATAGSVINSRCAASYFCMQTLEQGTLLISCVQKLRLFVLPETKFNDRVVPLLVISPLRCIRYHAARRFFLVMNFQKQFCHPKSWIKDT